VIYRMAPVTLSNTESHFSCFKAFPALYLATDSTCCLGYVHTRIGKCMWPIMLMDVSKMKNFLRSLAATCTINVVIQTDVWSIT